MTGKLQSWFRVRLIAGFFVTVPVVLTLWVFWVFYREVDGVLSPVYERLLGRSVPALGFLTAVGLLFLIGLIATNVVGRRVLQWGEGLLFRLPVFRRVYPTIKELVEAFSPNRRSGFREFVLVEHPREGFYAYGFLTADVHVDGAKPESLATVFLPTNHLYLGDIVLVPRESIIATGLSVEEGIRIILSAGSGAPRRITGAPVARSATPRRASG